MEPSLLRPALEDISLPPATHLRLALHPISDFAPASTPSDPFKVLGLSGFVFPAMGSALVT